MAPPQDKSAFLSFLDWMDEFGQVPLNLLRGNVGAAGRHTANIVGQGVDAFLPGFDVIPELASKEDYVQPHELAGIDAEESPFTSGAVDFLGNIAANPLTYLGGGAAKAIGGLAKSGIIKGATAAAKYIPGGEEGLEKVGNAIEAGGRYVRKVTGNQRLSEDTRGLLQDASSTTQNVTKAGLTETRRIMQGLNPKERSIVSDAIDNLRWTDGKNGRKVEVLAGDVGNAIDRVALHPDITAESLPKVQKAVTDLLSYTERQFAEAKDRGILKDLGDAKDPREYLSRLFSGEDLKSASGVEKTALKTPEELAAFINDPANAGVKYERDALQRLVKRAEQHGTVAGRQRIGQSVLGKDFKYVDKENQELVEQAIRKMAPEDAQVLMDQFKGVEPREGFFKWLASRNRDFKKVAVYGAFIPRFGSISRNKISGIWQAAANPESRAYTGKQAGRLLSDLGGALDDGIHKAFGFKRLSKSELTKSIDQIEQAFATSGGVAENAIKQLPPELGEAVRHGVLDGFVSGEQLIKEMGRTGWKKGMENWMNWPGHIFQGVESRMRLGMYLDMMKDAKAAGKPLAEEAKRIARVTKDTFYDYTVSSKENRTARDILPFSQFAFKAVPQTAKLIAEKPWTGVALAQALNTDQDGPIYPYMEGKLNIPIGKDNNGNPQYVSGIGLPFESANLVPNISGDARSFGRDVLRNVVGSSQPLLKTAFAGAFNKDPYFETPFASYDKIPLYGSAGAAGRVYNTAAGTGLMQPIDSPLKFLDRLLDDKRGIGAKVLDNVTGANVVSVDPLIAKRQKIQALLSRNPDVGRFESLYNKSGDEDLNAVLGELNATNRELKKKKKAELEAAATPPAVRQTQAGAAF